MALFLAVLPIALVLTSKNPDQSLGLKIFVFVLLWVAAASFLRGVLLSYRFDGGALSCVWLGGKVLWTDGLGGMTNIREGGSKGLNSVIFVWPDRERRLWVSVSDIEAAVSRAASA
jgi:hypothetical protein